MLLQWHDAHRQQAPQRRVVTTPMVIGAIVPEADGAKVQVEPFDHRLRVQRFEYHRGAAIAHPEVEVEAVENAVQVPLEHIWRVAVRQTMDEQRCRPLQRSEIGAEYQRGVAAWQPGESREVDVQRERCHRALCDALEWPG